MNAATSQLKVIPIRVTGDPHFLGGTHLRLHAIPSMDKIEFDGIILEIRVKGVINRLSGGRRKGFSQHEAPRANGDLTANHRQNAGTELQEEPERPIILPFFYSPLGDLRETNSIDSACRWPSIQSTRERNPTAH